MFRLELIASYPIVLNKGPLQRNSDLKATNFRQGCAAPIDMSGANGFSATIYPLVRDEFPELELRVSLLTKSVKLIAAVDPGETAPELAAST